jgi:uncharacterized protein (DUF58 family)
LTFAELRPYEPGDDVRHLDWNVTARQNRPYVRKYIEERALSLWLIVDTSASLRFGPDGASKADRAAQAAALLAAAAIHNGDRVGLALVSDRVEAELLPEGGMRHLARVIRALVATPASSRRTSLAVGLAKIRRTTRRALIIVLSDFLTPEPVGIWRLAARRNEVIAIRVVDPREDELPDAGLLSLEDVELGTHQIVDSGSSRVREAYREEARGRRQRFRRWCADIGITGFEIATDADPIGPLIRFFTGKAARRGKG